MEEPRGMYVHPLMLTLLVTAIAVLLTVLVLRQPPAVGAAGPALARAATVQGAQAASGKTLYYSTMHPWIVQDHPGTCPICGMELVKMPPEEQAVYLANHPEMA